MDKKEKHVMDQIRKINNEIDENIEWLNYAASEGYQYEMAKIEIECLKQQRQRLKELIK